MKTFRATYLLSAVLLWLFSGICIETSARQSLGVVWDAPADTALAAEQLNTFSEAGIEYLEIAHPIEPELQDLLLKYELTVLVTMHKSYLTLSDIDHRAESLFEKYLETAEHYRTHFNIASLGLLTNSQTWHPGFDRQFSSVFDSLKKASNKSFYFQNSDKWYYFEAPQVPFGKLVFDQDFQKHDLSDIHTTFKTEITDHSNFIYFMHSRWLLNALESYPEFRTSLVNYHQTGHWNLPLPKAEAPPKGGNWLILLLLFLWAALAAQLKYFPYIRPMMTRYFLAHRFFVDDILQYRERAAIGGILLMIKHAIFGGIVCYIVSKILFTEYGLRALFHHYPGLALTGNYYISIFFLGVILILALQTISIFWLYLPAKNLDHLSQTINLYAGSFYLDFIIVTIMLTAYLAATGTTFILILAFLYLLIWFLAFNIAAFNTFRNMISGRAPYIFLTIVAHTLLFIAFVVALLTQTNIIQVLDLAISL